MSLEKREISPSQAMFIAVKSFLYTNVPLFIATNKSPCLRGNDCFCSPLAGSKSIYNPRSLWLVSVATTTKTEIRRLQLRGRNSSHTYRGPDYFFLVIVSYHADWGDGVAQLVEHRTQSRSKDPRFEPCQEHVKNISEFFRVKMLCWLAVGVPNLRVYTHAYYKTDHIRTLKIL